MRARDVARRRRERQTPDRRHQGRHELAAEDERRVRAPVPALRAVRDGGQPQASRIPRRARELGRGGGGHGENGDKTLGDEAVAGA